MWLFYYICFVYWRSVLLCKFCTSFILLKTASNAWAKVRQMSLAWLCMGVQYNKSITISLPITWVKFKKLDSTTNIIIMCTDKLRYCRSYKSIHLKSFSLPLQHTRRWTDPEGLQSLSLDCSVLVRPCASRTCPRNKWCWKSSEEDVADKLSASWCLSPLCRTWRERGLSGSPHSLPTEVCLVSEMDCFKT